MEPDFYAVLDVAPDADAEQITRAFRQLIRTLHPDASGTAPHDQAAADRLRQVLAAWHVLHDPDARAAYDRTRTAPMPPVQRARRPGSQHGPRPGTGARPDTSASTSTSTTPPEDADLIAGPTVIHARPPQPSGPHIRIGPPIRLDE
ncbi:MAG: J domain-containing protein [Catenulispora sp.]|nr:J domain-containing protein [Catenulispora sp.]